MLYHEESSPKIHAIVDITEQNEVVDESIAEWCPKPEVNALKLEIEKNKDIPDQLSAAEALSWNSSEVDFRPHLFNPITKEWSLVDSGSQITAWPPDPGDKLDPKVKLRAVNNTHMKCYGFKDVLVRR